MNPGNRKKRKHVKRLKYPKKKLPGHNLKHSEAEHKVSGLSISYPINYVPEVFAFGVKDTLYFDLDNQHKKEKKKLSQRPIQYTHCAINI